MKHYAKIIIHIMLIWNSSLLHADKIYPEKPIVVVIPSYNNSKYYERNLRSVLSQNYNNFYVIYTDDCSPDETGALVEAFLENNDPEHKVILIKNSERRGALYNLYTMIHMCDDEAIIATLDGDDWFPEDDKEVLSRLNAIYSENEVWLTYGQFELYPSKTKGWASEMPDYIVKNNAFRDFQHLPTHLRTFYAWLFKRIKAEDFLYHGMFYSMAWDQVMMFPMIEMAGERHAFIPEIMYIYNDENSISDHHVSRQLQAYLAQVVRSKKRYQRLSSKPEMNKQTQESQATAIVFAQTASGLQKLLDSLHDHVADVGSIAVLYKPQNEADAQLYHAVRALYPHVSFVLIDEHSSNFKRALYALYTKSVHDYILFIKGDVAFEKKVSLSDCVSMLEDMQAYAFYFKLNAQNAKNNAVYLPLIECKPSVFAWNFSYGQNRWSCANSLDCVLHKKRESLLTALQEYYNLTPSGLEMVWGNEGNLDKLGLCFYDTCVRSI